MSASAQSNSTGDGPRRSVLKNPNTTLVIVFVVLLVIVFLIFLIFQATQTEQLHAEYGKRHGPAASDSVNGTGVLARMFDVRGFDVATWKRLSPKLHNFDTVVWFPDRLSPPSAEERNWFDTWLQSPHRTLVYIGRDYDALTAYLEMILPTADAEDRKRLQGMLAEAKRLHNTQRGELQDQDAGWFRVSRGGDKREIDSLQGKWSDGVDGSKTWIELRSQFDPPDHADHEVLLASGQSDVLAMRVTDWSWGNGSKIIVVTNGSFLLNVSLVNREHRKLAGKLIDECGSPGKVAFLESDMDGPRIYDEEPAGEEPTWEAMATVWPFGPILMQFAALGVIVCFAVAPILGARREPDVEGRSDFAKHIDALGRLLSRTQNRSYAQARLSYYQEKVRRESGVAHAEGRKPTTLLTVEIRFVGTTFATAEETEKLHRFEQQISRRKIGKVVGSTSGLGKTDITIEVTNQRSARQAIQTVLRQLHLDYRANITSDTQHSTQ